MRSDAAWWASISSLGVGAQLIASPNSWMKHLSGVAHQSLDYAPHALKPANAYLNMLSGLLSSAALECNLAAEDNSLNVCQWNKRFGRDQPTYAVTMAGVSRMRSVEWMIAQLRERKILGAYLEAGVWRGGMSVFAAAALQVYHQPDRSIFLVDSFQGLPPPRDGSLRPDEAFYATDRKLNQSLAVGAQHVLSNFDLFNVRRDKVELFQGYFVNSLPPLRQRLLASGEKIAILRMDGDMCARRRDGP